MTYIIVLSCVTQTFCETTTLLYLENQSSTSIDVEVYYGHPTPHTILAIGLD